MTVRDLFHKPQPCGLLYDFLPSGEARNGVFFDATISVQHSRTAEVTEFPVEQGSDIADHRRKQADTVTISALLGNAPSGLVPQLEAFSEGTIWDSARARDIFAKVLEVFEGAEFCTLITTIQLYEGGVLTSLVVDDDTSNGDAIRITATWRQIRLARSEVVALEEEPGAPPKKTPADAGTKAAPAAPDEDISGLKSFIKPDGNVFRAGTAPPL